jgi:hypothetical protein
MTLNTETTMEETVEAKGDPVKAYRLRQSFGA